MPGVCITKIETETILKRVRLYKCRYLFDNFLAENF